MSNLPRPRAIRVFLYLIAFPLVFTFLGSKLEYALFASREPLQAFAEEFDSNLAHTIPIAAEALRGDAALHDEVLRRTLSAYAGGGWPAANVVLQMVMLSKLGPYGDDEHVLALERANLALLTKLQGDPLACARYAMVGFGEHSIAIADAETVALTKAQWALIQSAAAGKRSGAAWYTPGAAEWRAVSAVVLKGKSPLTRAEVMAVASTSEPNRFPAAVTCSAFLKFSENLLALSSKGDAAYASRILLSFSDRPDFVARMQAIRQQ